MADVTAPNGLITAKKVLLVIMAGIIVLAAVSRALGGGGNEGSLAFAGYGLVYSYLLLDFVLDSRAD